eukprot:Skav214241  [mRNA]  locus=scaffold1133:207900:208160:- [translate_table: standard]
MTLELPSDIFTRVVLALLPDVTNTVAIAFPRADEQSCRLGFKALAATTQTCVRHHQAILVADLWGTLADPGRFCVGCVACKAKIVI